VVITRRQIIARTAAGVVGAVMQSPLAKAFEWQTVPSADAGFVADLGERFDKLVADKRVWGVHGVVVVRHGRIALERYFAGDDEVWGTPIGRVAFGPNTLHDLRSVSKSILSLLYGLALAQGKVPSPDEPLLDAFQEYQEFATDARFRAVKVEHALTMSLGLEWNEDIPYQDPANSEIQMEKAPDRFRYIFTRPFVADPGQRWIYGAAATALIGRLITKGTGQSLPDFARAALFDPLGIGATAWSNGLNGEASASSGLRMTPRDLARVGQMILEHGQCDGRQVVPADWLDRSFRPRFAIDDSRRYGYFWYLGDPQYGTPPNRPTTPWIGALGYGGQCLFVLTELDAVVAITCGNYADRNRFIPPIRIVREVVLPGVV
jgi:CubicO group peptidase (beta-lactamase class C family)